MRLAKRAGSWPLAPRRSGGTSRMAVVRYFVVFAWFLIGLASRPSMAQTSAGAASWRNLGRFAFGTLTGRPVADTLLVEHSGSVLFQQVADTLLVELSSDSAGGDPGAAATVWVLLSDGNAAKLKSKRALTIGSSAGPPVLQTLFSFEKAAEPEAVVIMRGKQIQVLPVASLVGLFTESTAETAPDSSSNRWDWPFMDLEGLGDLHGTRKYTRREPICRADCRNSAARIGGSPRPCLGGSSDRLGSPIRRDGGESQGQTAPHHRERGWSGDIPQCFSGPLCERWCRARGCRHYARKWNSGISRCERVTERAEGVSK